MSDDGLVATADKKNSFTNISDIVSSEERR
jgi:hypothetical protein